MRNKVYLRTGVFNVLSLALIIVLILSGCAVRNTKQFGEFASAVRQVNEGTNAVLSKNIEWERQILVSEIMNKEKVLQELSLKRKDNFEWTYYEEGNLLYKLHETQSVFRSLSEGMLKYAELLAEIAGTEFISEEEYGNLAKGTNEQLNTLAKRLDTKVPGDAIGAFSIATAEIVKLVIEGKRKKALIKLLTNNQGNIERVYSKTNDLIDGNEMLLYKSYSKIFDSDKEKSTTKMTEALVQKVMKDSDDTLKSLDILKEAKVVCEKMPLAHRELLKSVKENKFSFEILKDIYARGKRMQSLYKELKETNKEKK